MRYWFRQWLVAGSAPSHYHAGILLIWHKETNFNDILIEIHTFSFKRMHLKCCLANGGLLSRPQHHDFLAYARSRTTRWPFKIHSRYFHTSFSQHLLKHQPYISLVEIFIVILLRAAYVQISNGKWWSVSGLQRNEIACFKERLVSFYREHWLQESQRISMITSSVSIISKWVDSSFGYE